MKRTFALLLCLSTFFASAQAPKLPTDYFDDPLQVDLALAGTFGELRSNHFHSGLDIKTQQREGLPVFASAEGYVSRINVAHFGYGKALYIQHPNGYTTVY
ncbi:MAG: M23 family metallopeptidase, partial [Salinimicrobium sediminis]|nr:M23 family metallopeptidase [Salinimicrobium sediminis]